MIYDAISFLVLLAGVSGAIGWTLRMRRRAAYQRRVRNAFVRFYCNTEEL
jgi:hypothetical protein